MTDYQDIFEKLKANKALFTTPDDIRRESLTNLGYSSANKKRLTRALNTLSHPDFKLTSRSYVGFMAELLFYKEENLANFKKRRTFTKELGETTHKIIIDLCDVFELPLGALADHPLADTYFSRFSDPTQELDKEKYNEDVKQFLTERILKRELGKDRDLSTKISSDPKKSLTLEFHIADALKHDEIIDPELVTNITKGLISELADFLEYLNDGEIEVSYQRNEDRMSLQINVTDDFADAIFDNKASIPLIKQNLPRQIRQALVKQAFG